MERLHLILRTTIGEAARAASEARGFYQCSPPDVVNGLARVAQICGLLEFVVPEIVARAESSSGGVQLPGTRPRPMRLRSLADALGVQSEIAGSSSSQTRTPRTIQAVQNAEKLTEVLAEWRRELDAVTATQANLLSAIHALLQLQSQMRAWILPDAIRATFAAGRGQQLP